MVSPVVSWRYDVDGSSPPRHGGTAPATGNLWLDRLGVVVIDPPGQAVEASCIVLHLADQAPNVNCRSTPTIAVRSQDNFR